MLPSTSFASKWLRRSPTGFGHHVSAVHKPIVTDDATTPHNQLVPVDFAPWAEVLAVLIVGALASVPTLTLGTRLRNRISFWSSQVQGTDLDYDSRFAESMRRDATARLVALEAYPMWRSLASAYGAYLGLAMAVMPGGMGPTIF